MALPVQVGVQATRPAAGRSRQLLVPLISETHPLYGRVHVDEAKVRRMAENFAAGIKTYHGRLPFVLDHDEADGAAGWITRVWPEANGLWGEVEWTPSGVEAIEAQTYPFISPEWRDKWRDNRTGATHYDVFDGASLVVRPEFRDLPPAEVQHYTEDPAPTVILRPRASDPEEESMPDDERVDVAEQATETAATDGELETTAEVTDDAGATEAEETTETTDQAVEAAAEDQAEASEVKQTFSEADADELRDYRAKHFSERVGALKFGETGKRRLTPASQRRLAEALGDVPRRFSEPVLGALEQAEFYETGERGVEGAGHGRRQFSEAEQSAMRQLGLTEEDMR